MIAVYSVPERRELILTSKRVAYENPGYNWDELFDELVRREVPSAEAEPTLRNLIRVARANDISLNRV